MVRSKEKDPGNGDVPRENRYVTGADKLDRAAIDVTTFFKLGTYLPSNLLDHMESSTSTEGNPAIASKETFHARDRAANQRHSTLVSKYSVQVLILNTTPTSDFSTIEPLERDLLTLNISHYECAPTRPNRPLLRMHVT